MEQWPRTVAPLESKLHPVKVGNHHIALNINRCPQLVLGHHPILIKYAKDSKIYVRKERAERGSWKGFDSKRMWARTRKNRDKDDHNQSFYSFSLKVYLFGLHTFWNACHIMLLSSRHPDWSRMRVFWLESPLSSWFLAFSSSSLDLWTFHDEPAS